MNNSPLPITLAVVDDHTIVREGMCEILALMGFQIIMQAENGRDFLAQLAGAVTLPDLCLLDINMPIMKQLWPGIKILGYTFNSGETDKMLESGADACILKCCNAMEFKKAILKLSLSHT